MYHHNKRQSLEDLRRAYYATHTMVTLLDSQQITLNPTQYGYQEDGDLLMPEMAIQPVPEEFAVHCNCTKCVNARCLCRKKENTAVNFVSVIIPRTSTQPA